MLIGLCGRAGSGKSSVANHIVEKYGATKIAFADPLKKMAMAIWGFSEEQVYGDAVIKEKKDPHWGFSPRWALQYLGTEICREHLGEDVWINALISRIDRENARDYKIERIWVVEDLRFLNEAIAIRNQLDGCIIRLHCSDSISTEGTGHASEKEVDLIPVELVTDIHGTRSAGLPSLFAHVDAVIDRWIGNA